MKTSGATVGILLKHPTASVAKCKEREDPCPLQYGEPIGVPSWKDGTYHQDYGEDVKENEQMYEIFLDYHNDEGASAEFISDNSSGGDFGHDNNNRYGRG